MAIKKHEPLSTAKALIGFLCLSIVFVMFWKFQESEAYFLQDLYAQRNYIIAAFLCGALLVILFYHASQTTHSDTASKSAKKAKSKKK